MQASLYSAAAGMEAAESLHQVTAQNLAFAHIPGFLRGVAIDNSFQWKFNQAEERFDSYRSESLIDFTAGTLEQTGGPLDFALNGPGFFVVEGPSGPLYSRSGAFHLSPDGTIVNIDGLAVRGNGGPITLPPDASLSTLTVDADGTIMAGGAEVGRLEIAQFEDPQLLRRVGASLLQAPPEATRSRLRPRCCRGSVNSRTSVQSPN
ncbi:MAG: flagellar hook basal-body protein [Planctomycetaceae bacterium]